MTLHKIPILIVSSDSAMQLDLCIRSLILQNPSSKHVTVCFTASNDRFLIGYRNAILKFNHVNFIRDVFPHPTLVRKVFGSNSIFVSGGGGLVGPDELRFVSRKIHNRVHLEQMNERYINKEQISYPIFLEDLMVQVAYKKKDFPFIYESWDM
jgi:hypothetical protein